jgi:hypothetical protein
MTWGAIGGAAVGVFGNSLLGGSGGGGGGGYPDPAATAAAQGRENRRTFRYQLDNSRVGSSNPFGRSRWRNNAVFDQAGYDAALARSRVPTGASQPSGSGTAPAQSYTSPSDFNPYSNVPSAATNPPSLAAGAEPDRTDFEGPAQWENIQELSPDSQGIYDASTGRLREALNQLPTSSDAYSQSAADAVYRRTRRYQDVADEQARSSQQSNLADRGFQLGNEATSAERTRLDDSISRGVADSADRAQGVGFAQGQQQLSMQQQLINTLQAMRDKQVAGVSGLSSTINTPSLNPVDIAGLTQNQYIDSVNRGNAQASSQDRLLESLIGGGRGLFNFNQPSAPRSFGGPLDSFYRGTGGSGD